jgi:L-amino acid N-acyltransferase YncA
MSAASAPVRDAGPADLAGILAIYNHAVVHTTAIWNERVVDLADRERWWRGRTDAGMPVLVAEDAEGAVAGYASYGPFRPFEGYRDTVEHSIYVRADLRGHGIGGLLLAQLVQRGIAAGLHVMVGGIEAGNVASVALHRRHGFVEAGVLKEVGIKFGRRLDLLFMTRVLA